MPAIQRYDGPLFRVIRRYLREPIAQPPMTWIVSGEFGLIRADNPIVDYDQRLTADRASSLRPFVRDAFARAWHDSPWDELLVCVGRLYAGILADCWPLLPPTVTVKWVKGSIGGRATQLREWLYGSLNTPAIKAARTGVARLRDRTVRAELDEVRNFVRRELPASSARATNFQSWCVDIDGVQVAPKWLVSRLTGLPVSRFRTAEAIRFLNQLGIDVCRSSSPAGLQHPSEE